MPGSDVTQKSAKQKVICLGLGRTGTLSLRNALAMLGFGPCYHMSTIVHVSGAEDLPKWRKIGDGEGTPEDIQSILDNYGSVLDYPAAMYGKELLAAYPEAKFILTIRDPAKWEKSMRETVFLYPDIIRGRSPMHADLAKFIETYEWEKYHQGRIFTHTQQEFLDHIERVKQIIPADKLLVYEVGEGWDRLVEYLGVPTPTEPFPRVNDTLDFQVTTGIIPKPSDADKAGQV
ncbi:hypothetical protein K439DRAFT_1661425 [Ramaria rubella]|nr:hypothetical protein K439DRAFT_1661425 [Ramaria rubella]